ncbi:MAG: VWA domain-containing protein [Planctomycetes bacterium]|nr:VWA domain-containing protein [Planctomycetota bacterium]
MPSAGPVLEPPAPPTPEVVVLIATQRFTLLLDRSGSMYGAKFAQLQLAAKFWIDWVEADEQFGILSYADSTTVDVPLADVPSDPAVELATATAHANVVDALTASGNTAIGDALRAGLGQITPIGRAADQVFVLVTDGVQTAGTETPSDVVPDLISKGVRVITLGVGADHDPVVLEAIATATGGEYRPIPVGGATDDQAEEISTLLIELAGTVRMDSALLCMQGLAPGAPMEEARRAPDEKQRPAPFRDIEVLVTEGARRCTLGAVWFGAAGDFRVELLDPLGRVIGHSSSTRLRGGTQAYSFGTIDAPLAGKWSVRVHGLVRADARVRVFGFEERSGLRLTVDCAPRFPAPNGTLQIRARLHAPMPVPGASVRARVRDARGWSRELELQGLELRAGGHAPPHAYQAELQLPDDLLGPVTVEVEARHQGGRVRVELDGRVFSRPDLEIERAFAAVHVPACVRRKRVVLRLASTQDDKLPFRRGSNTVPTWVPRGQQRFVDAWNARHRRR